MDARGYIGDVLGRAAEYWPDRLAVVDAARGDGGRFSYAALNGRANRLAAWLRDACGVRKGDRVATLAHNGVESLDAYFACGKLGAIFVPLNWRLHPRELEGLMAQLRARALLFSGDFAAPVAQLQAGPSAVPHLLHLDGPGTSGSSGYEETLARAPDAAVSEPSLEAEDIACLLFTGGTTGLPKAARISQRMVAWNTLNTMVHELRGGDVTITHTPLFHTGGLLVYTVPLLIAGGRVVLMRRWDPDEFLRLVEAERVTAFFCVPTQYQQLSQSPRFSATDFSSVRFMTSGGAPLPVPLIRAFQAVHPVPFKQGFGMTEFGPGSFSMGPEHAVAKAGSIGRPNYFVAARLVDAAGAEVQGGEVGELLLRGPSMFSGYFEQPEETAKAIDAGGWFHTGDLARRDADGFFFIAGRKKEMFISGGENVFPVEIDAALQEHPAVALAATVGRPDPRWGEAGHSFVVLRPGASASPEELIEFLRGRLARFKVPKAVEIRNSLPLSAAGKVLRRELQSELANRP